MPRRKPALATAIALAAVVAAAGSGVRAADAELGAHLAAQCVTCHRPTGAAAGIPSIHGRQAENFIAAMNAYRSKQRENQVMRGIAASLSDEEIAALAAYFSTLPNNR